jgi:hypothetical protein
LNPSFSLIAYLSFSDSFNILSEHLGILLLQILSTAPFMSASRPTRRAAAKAIDYSQEQQFSDAEDIFEDSGDEEVAKPKRSARKPRKSGGARRSTGGGEAGMVREMEVDDDGEYQAPKVVYTEKGYDPSLPPIRERFDFMPEYEPDGSPRIELIVGRRPVDEKGNSDNENEDDDEDGNNKDSDDDDDSDDSDDSDSAGRRRRGKKKKASSPSKNNPAEASGVVEYEYLVKYKGRSYLHLEWKTGADLESMNKSAKTLYRRYLKKIEQGLDDELENPDFDPSFAVPQKIIDEGEQEIELELTDKELIKWEKEREKALAEDDGSEGEEMKVEGANVDDEEAINGEEKKEGESEMQKDGEKTGKDIF